LIVVWRDIGTENDPIHSIQPDGCILIGDRILSVPTTEQVTVISETSAQSVVASAAVKDVVPFSSSYAVIAQTAL
jgi:hypothetical protein